jgi:hypothetical protein
VVTCYVDHSSLLCLLLSSSPRALFDQQWIRSCRCHEFRRQHWRGRRSSTFSSPSHPPSSSRDVQVIDIQRSSRAIFNYAAGLCFAADAMEVLLLSFLAVVLRAEWNLTASEEASIVSVVFAGAMLGTLILSPLGDAIGRRPVFTFTAAVIAILGVATAFCVTYRQLLVMRSRLRSFPLIHSERSFRRRIEDKIYCGLNSFGPMGPCWYPWQHGTAAAARWIVAFISRALRHSLYSIHHFGHLLGS